MRADDGVLVDNRLAALDAAAAQAGIRLLDGRVRRLEAVQALLEGGAEAVVGLDGVDEERVAARLGLVQDVQEGGSGRLLLVRHVRVPGHGGGAVGEVAVNRVVAGPAVNDVDLGEAGGRAGSGVDVVALRVVSPNSSSPKPLVGVEHSPAKV